MSKPDPAVERLTHELRGTRGALEEGDLKFVGSFWQRDSRADFPPATITRPEEYADGEYLSIRCTQTDLAPREQTRLVARWCELLPSLDSVRYLWFQSKVSQALFEAACRVPQLEGLYIKWSGISTLDDIGIPTQLRYLYLGTSGSIRSIEPLARLRQLKWLQLEGVRVESLEALASLSNLEGLGFVGADGLRQSVASFAPLSGLTQLQWLHLGAIRTQDDSLRPLGALRNLRWLGLANCFPKEEFAWLSTRLPHTRCDWLAPYAKYPPSAFPCRACKANWRVMTSGRGSKLLCPTCDAAKLARHVLAFQEAQAAAMVEPA